MDNWQVYVGAALLFLVFWFSYIRNRKPKPKPDPDPQPAPKPEPAPPKIELPTLVDIPIYKERVDEVDSEYATIMNRVKDPVYGHDRSTNAHESIHFLNAELRNAKQKETGYKTQYNALYAPDEGGKIFYIEEPNMRKKEVGNYVPNVLRWNRFKTYVTGQLAWDDRPLYLVDEWVAYIGGGLVDVQGVQTGRHEGEWSDGVSGMLEFSIYCTALCMAIKDRDNEWWEKNKEFRLFISLMLRKARKIYFEGKDMNVLKWDKQEKLRETLLESRDAEPIRAFMREELDDAWLEQ